jgi:hypothetical protein
MASMRGWTGQFGQDNWDRSVATGLPMQVSLKVNTLPSQIITFRFPFGQMMTPYV